MRMRCIKLIIHLIGHMIGLSRGKLEWWNHREKNGNYWTMVCGECGLQLHTGKFPPCPMPKKYGQLVTEGE